MNIIKNQLSFRETIQFVESVVSSVFTQDSEGIDIDYSPSSLHPLIQATFAEFYTDMKFLPTVDEEGNEIEGNFDKNFKEYMAIDIDTIDWDINGNLFNRIQYIEMLNAIDETIDFRKQKMLQNDSVSKYVKELLQTQIEVQKLQKKILQQNEKMSKQFTPDEIRAMNENIAILNQSINSPDYQKGLASAINTVKPFKRPDDYKKSKKVK